MRYASVQNWASEFFFVLYCIVVSFFAPRSLRKAKYFYAVMSLLYDSSFFTLCSLILHFPVMHFKWDTSETKLYHQTLRCTAEGPRDATICDRLTGSELLATPNEWNASTLAIMYFCKDCCFNAFYVRELVKANRTAIAIYISSLFKATSL